MDRLRWAACLLSVGVMFAFTGCAWTSRTFGRWMTPSEYDEYMLQKQMNDKQSSLITALTFDKEHLTAENGALRTELGDKTALIDASKKIMDNMQAQLDQFNKTAPPGEERSITSFLTPYGEVGLRMKGDVLFASGDAKLKPGGETVLKKVAEMVRDKPNNLAVCGFTDSDPIRRTKWGTNFNLSGARSLAVLDFLEKEGIKPNRMHFCGYGQYALISDPGGKENKAKSRRAEIILLNPTSPGSAPAETPAAPEEKQTPVVPK